MLTDKAIRAAAPRERSYRIPDGQGLHLEVSPSGGRLWRYRYEFAGKEKLLALGAFPAVGLASARQARAAARALIAQGRDPGVEKKARRFAATTAAETTFEGVARAWHAQQAPRWTAHHAADVLDSLSVHVFPHIGRMPIGEVTSAIVLGVLRRIEARPAVETAHRVRQRMSAIFVYAIPAGLIAQDPAATVKPALAPVRRGRQPALTELEPIREILFRAEATPAHPGTKLALRLMALTAVRTIELRGARWPEFEGLDGPEPLWRVPAGRMKMKREHLVPLVPDAVATIRAVATLTGGLPLVFPNTRSAHRPMSENALGYLLNRAGFHGRHVPHGWRAAFSSIMNERFPADRAVIDLMLAHLPKDKVEAAYNRATHMPRRRELAQTWALILMAGMPPADDLLQGPRR